MRNFSKIKEAIKSAEQEFELGNSARGRQLLVECLLILREGRTDIWQGRHLTSELGDLFERLADNGSPSEILDSLKHLILEHSTEDWRVANFLIELLNGKIQGAEKVAIVNAIKGHVEYLTRSDWALSPKYAWLKDNSEEGDDDDHVIGFILWLLNHPYKSVCANASEVIMWLAEVNSSKTLKVLIEISLAKTKARASEASARLLATLSKQFPNETASVILSQKQISERLLSINHFMISVYWLEVLNNCTGINAEIGSLFDMYVKQFPTDNSTNGDIFLDEPFLRPVESIIDKLNNLGILNRRFCEQLKANVEDYSKPLAPIDQLRVERYIERSFYEDVIWEGSYKYLLRYAINNALIGKVSYDQIASVRQIIELESI